MGLGDAGRDRADAGFRDELHRDAGGRVGAFQVVDELRQVLDGVDVVVGRRRDERRSLLRVAEPGHERVDLVRGKLSALAGLGALRKLDLQVLRGAEILDRHAEAPGGHLLDAAVGVRPESLRVLAPFAGIRHGAERVERARDGLVRFG